MWNKPYSLKEGSAITIGLMLIGLILQFTIGPLEWGLFMWPANIIALTIFVALLLVVWLLRKHFYFCRFMASMQAAVPAIAGAALLTIIMGLTRQLPEGRLPADPIGLTKMLNFWPFILVYVWMTAITGGGYDFATFALFLAPVAFLRQPLGPLYRLNLRHTRQCGYAALENVL